MDTALADEYRATATRARERANELELRMWKLRDMADHLDAAADAIDKMEA
jgi:hypothetical protein